MTIFDLIFILRFLASFVTLLTAGVGLMAHEGSFCFPGCFIIGDDGNPVHKPTVVPLSFQ
jgi:hypothetical protein